MTIKDQFTKIKENWLIVVIIIILFLFLNFGGLFSLSENISLDGNSGYFQESSQNYLSSRDYSGGSSDFAPEVEERLITKTARINNEVKRGEFMSSEQKLKEIISSSESYLLSESSNKYGTKRKEYYTGSYQIKVNSNKFDILISQLKDIGEIKVFSTNTQDITGQYTNTKLNLELEKERLNRYLEMYKEANNIDNKITLNDKIFDQERRVKYLQDSIDKSEQKVEYSTIYFTLTEKRSDYADVSFVKFSNLIESFVNSLNTLIHLFFIIIPWAIAYLILRLIYKLLKKFI